MEKLIVTKWILPYVSSKLNPNQFAYLPGTGKGTSVALTLLNDHILRFLDRKSGCVRLLAADFSKAFDKLTFQSIMSAICKFNLPRQAAVFLSDFLCNRKQRVRLRDEYSEWFDVTSGVPQGSVVGPILFTLVIDSFAPICNNSVCIKFADDVSILHFVRDPCDDLLQMEWLHLEDWSLNVGLHLHVNYKKSVVMDFNTKKSLVMSPVLSRDGAHISNVTSLKLLGVTFSSDLTWNYHVSDIVSRCYRRLYILRNLKRANCPPHIIYKCYVAFIRSVLLYCFPTFCNMPKYLLKKVVRVEKRAAKFFPEHEFCDFLAVADDTCRRLFDKVVRSDDHPLKALFDVRPPTRSNPCHLQAPFAKTCRFSNSFLRFGRPP